MKIIILTKLQEQVNKLKADLNDHAATILGVVVAVAMAWMDIDWSTFTFERDWKKLVLSGVIAAGGYLSKLKLFKPKIEE